MPPRGRGTRRKGCARSSTRRASSCAHTMKSRSTCSRMMGRCANGPAKPWRRTAGNRGRARGRRPVRLASLLGITLVVCGTLRAHADQFDSHWHDGKAELDGYRLTVSRYGQERTGTAVMIFVTEPFSTSKHVKVDNPRANPADTFDALKLNLVRDFQTGIYDYNTMVSVFVRSDTFAPVKVSFSSAEWCGHV